MSMAGVGGDAKFLKTEAFLNTIFHLIMVIIYLVMVLNLRNSFEDEKVTSSNRFYFNSNSVRGFDQMELAQR